MIPSAPTHLAVLASLFQNLSLLLSLTLIYSVARPWLRRLTDLRSAAVTGIIFGLFSIAATFAPVLLETGARFDGRNILIATAGAFGGPFSAIISGTIFLIFRIWAGGNGLLPAFPVIVLPSTLIIVGVSAWMYLRVGQRQCLYTPRQLALLGLYIAAQSLLVSILSAPTQAVTGSILTTIGLPLLIAYPAATALIGTLLVNERRRTTLAEDLRESELRFRQMAESIDQSFSLRDSKTGRILYVSPGFERIWGRPAQMALESTEAYLETIHPDDRERFAAERLYAANDPGHVYQYRVVRPDGSVRDVRALSYPVVEADGSVRRVAGVAEDITERKQTEKALRDSEERFRQMAESIDQVFWLRDAASGKIIYLSPAFEKIWGRSSSELGGLGTRLPGIHPDDQARIAASFINLDQGPREVEYRIQRPDGQERWIVSRSYPVIDASGAVTRIAGTAEDITIRKRTEEALRESQYFVEHVANTVPDGIFVMDLDERRFVFANKQVSAALGYTPEEFEAMGAQVLARTFHPDDLAKSAAWDVEQRTMRDGDTREFEYRLITKSGDTRWMTSRHSPFQRGANGEVTQIIGVTRDVTERRRIEEALRQSQHFVERIAGAVPDLLYVYDMEQFDKIFENQSIGAYLGYAPEQIAALGPRPTGRLLHPDDFAYLASAEYIERQKHLADGEIIETEYRMKHANGEWRWLYSRDVPFQRADDGTVLQLIGVARDVTERKATEEALRQSQLFVERVTNSVRDRIYVYDLEQKRSVYSNRDFAEMLGYTQEQMAGFGSLIRALMHPDDQVNQRTYAEKLMQLKDGETLEFEYRMRHASGEWRWLYGHDTPFERDADGQVRQVLGVVRDITDRKRSEEKLQRYAEALERNNEELQMFAYTASHDLQEPLRKIQAFGDRLQIINSNELTDQGRDYLLRMMNAANRMQSLIQDLLAYSRITRINQPFAPVNMNEVASAVCSDLEVAIAQANAEVDISPLYTIDADPTQMRQLLQNLIGNALKFRAPDRDPIVRVSGRLIDARDDGTEADTPLYQLTVADNGIGFEDKYTDRIFGMFQRLHGRNEYEGTGIGLAICRKIAERHHGTIQAIGNPGQGATFIVTIPVRQPIQEEMSP